MRIYWGTVDANGVVISNGGGASVSPEKPGAYDINLNYTNTPAIVGSQTSSGNSGEANTDGIVFPFVTPSQATAFTGNNVGSQQNRSFSFITAGEANNVSQPIPPTSVLWGAINADGLTLAGSGGFKVSSQGSGKYVISFSAPFNSMPAIVATQTNSGSLSEANTDGVVVPILTTSSATLITGNNKSTPENRNFSFVVVGQPTPAQTSSNPSAAPAQQPYGPNSILWASVNADGTVDASSGGLSVAHQATGMYVITFPAYNATPSIVGSQTRSSNASEDSREGMVFPWVNKSYAVAITGDASGNQQDRSFSFIVVGPQFG